MADKQMYQMKDANGIAGVFSLTETEVEQLRSKGWDVTYPECANDTVIINVEEPENYHLIDSNGVCQGSRRLKKATVENLRANGWHLVHVGDASKDMDEVRAIQAIME